MGRDSVCAFFGHRTVDEDISDALHKAIRKAIEEFGVTTFGCGNKGEFDRLAAKAVFAAYQAYSIAKKQCVVINLATWKR